MASGSTVRNYDSLATSPERKLVLDLVEAGLKSIQPAAVMQEKFSLSGGKMTLKGDSLYETDINQYGSINLLGFGKGSAEISKYVARQLRTKLKKGYVIDSVWQDPEDNSRYPNMVFVEGSHPRPSQSNIQFTKEAVEYLSSTRGSELTVFVVCGGGSAMLVDPYKMGLEAKMSLTKVLLESGADISEVNTVRKHVSNVKGGQLVQRLYREDRDMVAMMFSDVPSAGNDKSFIASGPTVPDSTKKEDAMRVLKKYGITENIKIYDYNLKETPKNPKFFERTRNVMLLTNRDPLAEMVKAAEKAGTESIIYKTDWSGEARYAGRFLVEEASLDNGDYFRVNPDLHLKGKIRVISIENFDANPCSGTHLSSLSEINAVRIEQITSSNNEQEYELRYVVS